MTGFVVQGHISENISQCSAFRLLPSRMKHSDEDIMRYYLTWDGAWHYFIWARWTLDLARSRLVHLHLNTKAQQDSARPSFWSWQALSLIFTSSHPACVEAWFTEVTFLSGFAALSRAVTLPEEHDRVLNRITSLQTKAAAGALSIAGKPVKCEGWTQQTCPSHNAKQGRSRKQCREKRKTEGLKVQWKMCFSLCNDISNLSRTGSGHISPQNQMEKKNYQTFFTN